MKRSKIFTITVFLIIFVKITSCTNNDAEITDNYLFKFRQGVNLDSLIKFSKTPVLVRFTENNRYCESADSVFFNLDLKHQKSFSFVKFDVDSNYLLALKNNIQSVPFTRIFYKGKLLKEYSGALEKYELVYLLDNILQKITKKQNIAWQINKKTNVHHNLQ